MNPEGNTKTENGGEEYFHDSGIEHDIMKAPRRKRKPSGEPSRERRVVKMMWDEDPQTTSDLLDDMGVSLLSDEESLEEPHPTPPAPIQSNTLPQPPQICQMLQEQDCLQLARVKTINPFLLFSSQPQASIVSCKPYIRDHMEKLSDEVILAVFKWLPKTTLVRCACVCKRWKRLATDETLWRRLDLANRTLKPGVLGQVLNRGVAVLRLTKTTINMPFYIDNLLGSPRLCRIQYLDLSMATASPPCLEQLLAQCQLLRKLSMENCQINDAICRCIGNNHNIEVLNLAMCQGIGENGLVPICNNLKRLDSLNVGWTSMSRGAVLYMVICLSSSLTKLNLSGCRETLLDEDVQQLCGSCPHLKELDLSDATLLTSTSIEHIARGLQSLEYVALSRCYHIAPSSLPLLSHIYTLLALDVFGMLKESALYQLRAAMPSIEINKFPFSSIARPTTGIRRTSIWGLRVRDSLY